MDWRDWEMFCEAVRHGGVSAAAHVLGHPKSILGAAVQRLESNLGLRQIERTTQHLRPPKFVPAKVRCFLDEARARDSVAAEVA
jgi:DNA-binding transcriptional LysR family regulator